MVQRRRASENTLYPGSIFPVIIIYSRAKKDTKCSVEREMQTKWQRVPDLETLHSLEWVGRKHVHPRNQNEPSMFHRRRHVRFIFGRAQPYRARPSRLPGSSCRASSKLNVEQ